MRIIFNLSKWFCRRSWIKVFLVLALVAKLFSGVKRFKENMSFKDISSLRPGVNYANWNRTVCAIMLKCNTRNISVKLY